MRPIGRLGYSDYTCVDGDSIFGMDRPTWTRVHAKSV